MRGGAWWVIAVLAIGCGDDDELTVRADPEAQATEPSEPDEPTEVDSRDPDEARVEHTAPAPVEPQTDVIDAPTDAPLPEKMGRRLRNWLRQHHSVRSDIAAQHSSPRDGGGREVVTILRFSPFEACVAAKEEAGTESAAAREQCATTRDPQDWELEPSTTLRLLMGHFTATPPRRPAGWGGAMEVPTDVLLETSCSLSGDPSIERADMDGDGDHEVAIRYGCSTGDSMNRAESFVTSTEEYLVVARTDGTLQLPRWTTASRAEDVEMANQQMQREIRFSDENGDDTPDMIVETLTWDGSGCSPDEVTVIDDDSDDEYGDCVGERARVVYLYLPERDAWDVPERSR